MFGILLLYSRSLFCVKLHHFTDQKEDDLLSVFNLFGDSRSDMPGVVTNWVGLSRNGTNLGLTICAMQMLGVLIMIF